MNNIQGFRPKVSIIIPVYNGSNYLKEAIDSALAQTYDNIEVIVINDGSNDEGKTQAIIDSYGKKIRAYFKENGGVATALNLGIDMMEGEYFSWLSHDDLYLPTKIEDQVNTLIQVGNKDAIIYSGYKIMNESGQIISEFRPSRQYCLAKYTHALFPVLRLLVNGCTVLFHKNHFKRVGGFNINLITTQDYDMWYRLFRNQIVIYSEEIGVISRSHQSQTSRKNITQHVKECEQLWIGMLSNLSLEDIETLDDNAYAFFKKTADFLKARTLYYETIKYAEINALQQLRRLLTSGYRYHEVVNSFTEILDKNTRLPRLLTQPIIIQKKKPRIAFFASRKECKGGLMKMVNTIIQELTKYYEIIIVYSMADFPIGFQYESGITHIKMQLGTNWIDQLAKFFKIIGVDLFIGTLNCLQHFMNMYTTFKSYGIKCIAWNHEDYFFTKVNKTYGSIGETRKVVFHGLEAVVWNNRPSKWVYDQEASNGFYIPDCLPDEEIHPIKAGEEIVKEKYSLLAVGRYDDPIKGLDRLLEVFALLSKKYPLIRLYIVGECSLDMELCILNTVSNKTVRQRIEELGIDHHKIIFTNWISDLSSYYKKVKIQLTTSVSEGFGLVILEAANYGTPTIAFSNGGADSIIVNGENGYVVDSVSEMAKRVESLLLNNNLYKKIQENNKALLQIYNKESVAVKWHQLIEGILNDDETLLKSLHQDQQVLEIVEAIEKYVDKQNKLLNS